MNHKIKLTLVGLISLGVVLIPTSLLISSVAIKNSELSNSNNNSLLPPKPIKVPDYLTMQKSVLNKLKSESQKKLNTIVEKYDLWKWSQSYKEKEKSKIWELKFSEYSLKSHPTNKIYEEQDEQFKYFEDFIFTINPYQEQKNQIAIEKNESFLFQRYQLLAIKRGLEYYNHPISKINSENWIGAFLPIINPDEVAKIMRTFLSFYQEHFYKPYLTAADLLIRVRTKDYDDTIYNSKTLRKWAEELWKYEGDIKISIVQNTIADIPEELLQIIKPLIDKFLNSLDGIVGLFNTVNVTQKDFYTPPKLNQRKENNV